MLEHKRSFPGPEGEGSSSTTLKWLAYAYFHSGEPGKALELYRALLTETDPDPTHHVFAAACLFYLGRYDDAVSEANKGPETKLRTRVLFHCAHMKGDEQMLLRYHQKLSDSVEDQLSLASIHHRRGHHQEAVDIYKRLLLENKDHLALNVYVAMCYHKLEYHDVSCELLETYLAKYPDSPVAVNLKACNVFKLRDGKAAEAELRALDDSNADSLSPTKSGGFAAPKSDKHDLVRHNRVVFRNGDGATRVFPPLAGVPPEARLNLVIHHLREQEPREAYGLLKDLEPSTPHEYVLKGVTHAILGQSAGNETEADEHLKLAQQCFQIVGSSASECDTIPGRQSMASCFQLLNQHEDALVYLKSVAEFSKEDDDFHWNFGMCCAAAGDYKTGEEELLRVANAAYREEIAYKTWLAACFVRNGKASSAWTLCEEALCVDDPVSVSDDVAETATRVALTLLRVVADACYEMGEFYVAMRAFDELERLGDGDVNWEGKRGAAVGVFASVLAGKEDKETLRDVVSVLRSANTAEADSIAEPIARWARGEGFRME